MVYSESFEKLWNSRRKEWHPVSDSKQRAYQQFQKIKNVTADQMIFCLQSQYKAHADQFEKEGWRQKLPAMERWLRDRKFTDTEAYVEAKVTSSHPSHKPFEARAVGNILSGEEMHQRIADLKTRLGL